jgi:hypothetical protein
MSESAECCPEFNPEPWNKVTHQWKDKPFIIDTIPQFMHMPLPWMYRKVLARMWDKAKHLGIAPDLRDFLLLAYDPSHWKSELYLAVTKDSTRRQSDNGGPFAIPLVADGRTGRPERRFVDPGMLDHECCTREKNRSSRTGQGF